MSDVDAHAASLYMVRSWNMIRCALSLFMMTTLDINYDVYDTSQSWEWAVHGLYTDCRHFIVYGLERAYNLEIYTTTTKRPTPTYQQGAVGD